MNVFTSGTSIFSAASITSLRWPMTEARCSGSGFSHGSYSDLGAV